MNALSKKLKNKMQEKELSAHALEKKAGLKPSVVQNILQGKSKNPTIHTLQAVSQVLGCSIDELLESSSVPLAEQQVWNPALYKEVVGVAIDLFTEKKLSPNKKQALSYIEEIYHYTLSSNKPHVDRRFAEWLISKQWY